MKSFKKIDRISIVIATSILLLFVGLTSFSDFSVQATDPLAGWDKNVIKEANSAANVSYLSAEEKKLIFYTNLCRLNPKMFYQTVLADYLRKNPDQQQDQALLTGLKKELMETKACSALTPDEQLSTIAHDFAKKMGEEGKTGHENFQGRMKPVMNRYNRVGENCSYGKPLAEDAFMSLLIDKSDPVNLGHRKNMLDPAFTIIGVSGQPHKKFQYNFVMDFGGQ